MSDGSLGQSLSDMVNQTETDSFTDYVEQMPENYLLVKLIN